MEANKRCFVDSLDVLKISSKEAVENLDQFSDFKEYMHVKRTMQDQLIEMIKKASESNKSELIMICGSVGDGKSHLLSYIKHHYPEMMASFKLYNDASESFDPKKTSMDTLSEELDVFSDAGLESGEVKKIIIAINLGTLNNFIESKYKERFKKLRGFTHKYKIIEPEIKHYTYDETSAFHYVNFTDYHMYTLTEKGPQSKYIDNLLMKVLNEDETMYFGKEYAKTCKVCPYSMSCPVKANYEFLKDEGVRRGVINSLIKAIIKEKLIISTRDLLNFFYDIITGGKASDKLLILNQSKLSIDKLHEQMSLLLINNIFEGEERSHVLDKVALIDPIEQSNRKDEARMIGYQITNTLGAELQQDLSEFTWQYSEYLVEALNSLAADREKYGRANKLREICYKIYKRSQVFQGIKETDEIFEAYMRDLYAINRQYKKGLRDIVGEMKQVIYKWDGSVKSQGVRIISAKKHKDFGIYEPIAIRPYVTDLIDTEQEEVEQFVPHITLKFVKDGTQKVVPIELDYTLYELVKKLVQGYIVGEEEYRRNINLQLFIEKLLNQGEETEKKLIFEHIINGEIRRYELRYDNEMEDDQYEFVGI